MQLVFIAGLGGFIGSILRYTLTTATNRLFENPSFPVATLLINVFGCFVIGMLGAIDSGANPFSQPAKIFLFVGILGGFTTYSAFGYETFLLLSKNEPIPALLNVFLQLVCGLAAVWFGWLFCQRILLNGA